MQHSDSSEDSETFSNTALQEAHLAQVRKQNMQEREKEVRRAKEQGLMSAGAQNDSLMTDTLFWTEHRRMREE